MENLYQFIFNDSRQYYGAVLILNHITHFNNSMPTSFLSFKGCHQIQELNLWKKKKVNSRKC